jgi:DNA mismatch repair protein MutS2
MNRQQSQRLSLDQIFDLIEVPSDFLAAVKRQKLSRERLSVPQIRAAYQRRGSLLEMLQRDQHARWEVLLAHIPQLHPHSYHHALLAIHQVFELKTFIWHYQALRAYALEQAAAGYDFPDLIQLFELLDPEGNKLPSFRLSPAFSKKLRELDARRQQLNLKLKHSRQQLLEKARAQLDLPGLKAEFVLSRQQEDLISKIRQSSHFVLHRESIANLSYILADDENTNRLKGQIMELNSAISREEDLILEQLSGHISDYYPQLERAVQAVKELGWDYALAAFAVTYDCCIPTLADEIHLVEVRNLPLQQVLKAAQREYQSLDLDFDPAANLITGPNMGGKTSILKCMAQCALLLKLAIPLPAQSATLPAYDFVYYNHVSERENLSSFGVEVVALREALQEEGRGLFLLDEFAKGTNPKEGEALATAVISYLAGTPHTTIAATHFSAPARLDTVSQYQIKGIDSALPADQTADINQRLKSLALAMDYSLIRLSESQTPPLNAIQIAEILGLPQSILQLIESGE